VRIRRPRVARLALGIAAAVAVAALPQLASGSRARASSSFLSLSSLVDPTAINQYSLVNGRYVGIFARIPPIKETSEGYTVSNPHLMSSGGYMITLAHDVNCRQVPSSECIPIPKSCASHIETLDPNNKRFRLLFTEPDTRRAYEAVPSPDGRRVALIESGCLRRGGRIAIRDLRTGVERVALSNPGLCSDDVSWSSDGSRVVVRYARHFSTTTAEGACSLAVISSRGSTARSRMRVIRPDPGCGFSATAFDPTGLVAVEGCGTIDMTPTDRLLQFDRQFQLIRRVTLPPGTSGIANEQTAVAYDPQAHTVLVSESKVGVNAVCAFNGRRLRMIGDYRNAVLAQP
jgi:hypothetical protein